MDFNRVRSDGVGLIAPHLIGDRPSRYGGGAPAQQQLDEESLGRRELDVLTRDA